MIPPTGIQQPIPVVTQAQIPVDSLRVDNHQLPQVPRPAPLFASVSEKEAAARNHPSQSSSNSSLGATTGSEQAKIGEGEHSGTDTAHSDTAQEEASGKNAQSDTESQQKIRQLASRDREVRAHERAHASAGGQFSGAPSFTYTKGPNGVLYATSGEVSISTSKISGDPQASLAKLETVIRAALAPADPSSQDLRVAASAASAVQRLKSEITAEVRETQIKDTQGKTEDADVESQQTINTEENSSPQQRLEKLLQQSGINTTKETGSLLELFA